MRRIAFAVMNLLAAVVALPTVADDGFADAGTSFMHESHDKDDATRFSRTRFAWANTLSGELALKAHERGCFSQAVRLPVVPQPREWRPSGASVVVDASAVTYAIAADAGLGREGYSLTIAADGKVAATAPTETGILWARRTVEQLAAARRPVPCGTVRDWPKYRVRGVMLDVGRKFVRMETLRAMLRDLAHYKLNEFHIHLNDDGAPPFVGRDGYSAFRLECEAFPALTAKDGHYTKAEFRAFVKEAAALGVTVVPEIDSPAHSGCFIRLKPEFEGAYGKTHLALDKPAVRDFMEKLFAEYLDGPDPVFAGAQVHVGTDEYDKREAEPFRAYTDWMFRMVRRHGHEPRAWGALDHAAGATPVLADGKIVMDIWHNPYYDPLNALAAGYSIVAIPDFNLYIVPAAGFYFDYLDIEEIFRTWEPRVMGYRTLEGDEPGLLGGKFAIWNDLSGNGISEDDIADRLLHAVPVIAEKTWTGEKADLGWKEFRKLSAAVGEAPDVNLADRLTGKGDKAVGWTDGGYRVAFDVTFGEATRDHVLFDDGTSQVKVFKGGRLGFSRDGCDWMSETVLAPNESHRVVFCGDAVGVTVEADGKAIGDTHDLKYEWTDGRGAKKSNRIVRTLHFPLVPSKEASAQVSGLTVKTGQAFSRVKEVPADDWDLDALTAQKEQAVDMPTVAPGKTCPGVVLVGGATVGVSPSDVAGWVKVGYAVTVVASVEDLADRAAVETVIRANAALRERPGVDPYRIGLVCASRDGTLPGLVAGADRRFAFAVSLFDARANDATRGPKRYIERARGPFLFVDGQEKALNPCIPDWKTTRVSAGGGERLSLGPTPKVLEFADTVVRKRLSSPLEVRRARSGEAVPDAAVKRSLVTSVEKGHVRGHVLKLEKRQPGDFALEIEYAVDFPESAGALVWHHDMRSSRKVSPADGLVRNASRQQDVGTEWLSYWPFAAVTGQDGTGRALALDPDYPAFYNLFLDAKTRRLVLHLDVALTDESPTAEVRFVEYPVGGRSPFRSALTGYYARYPKAFASRTREHGVWMPFSKISEVKGWEDFGFKFKEGNNEPEWDKAHGIYTFTYTEPTTWWHDIKGPTNAYDLAQAAEKVKTHGDPLAKAWEAGVFHGRDGQPVGFIKDTPWCKGVVWNYNDAPGVAGETTGWKVKMNHAPRCEYVDSAEMYVTVPLDFTRAHFGGMKTPLCWDAQTGRPAIFKGLIGYEYVRAAAEKAHAANFLTMANGTPVEWFWLAPNLDVLGTEWDWQDWRNGQRVWTPPSDTELIYRRALCGKKPFCFLMNTDFALLTPERTRKYFDRCLAYGAFPGFFSIDAATAPYFTRPELYERDRPLYKQYLPVVKALSEAGWSPDNSLLETSDGRVVSEQFGDRYVTLFNPLDRALEIKIRFAGDKVREMLKNEAIARPCEWTTLTLAPESARVFDVSHR